MKLVLRCLAQVAFATAAFGNVTPASLFTDHAVLQRDKPVPVWGKADEGEKISVTFGEQTRMATAGRDGKWIVFLDALPASGSGADLTIAGQNTIVLHDVVVGEVWLCSGQSNMEFTVRRAADAPQEIARADFPLIRHVKIERAIAETPAEDAKVGAGWQSATPQTVAGFTAVGYFFARDLHLKLGVPVGLVHSSWGGTPIESWLSPAALASNPAFAAVSDRWQKRVAEYPAAKAVFDAQLAEWTKLDAAAKTFPKAAAEAWAKQNPRPRAPRGPGDSWTPTGPFNGMINPLLPYALRGALWYQGESNTDHASEYQALFAAMITGWRAHFGQGDFPFYWVNLANFNETADPSGRAFAFLREAQTKTLALPNTGQALAIDIGDPNDIHPLNKQEVGRRLALLAKIRLYGFVGDDTGPTFESATRDGAAMRVRFSHAGGLVAHDKPVQSLEIAGADRIFRPAVGKIEGETLLVSSSTVREPIAVRYAWSNAPDANLYNGAGLPAVPFRSDDW